MLSKINFITSILLISPLFLLLFSWIIPSYLLSLPVINQTYGKIDDKFITFAMNTTNANYTDIGYFVTGI